MTILVQSPRQGQVWDLAGIGASSLCVLHCLAMPFLVVFVPVMGLVEKQTHATFALAILAIGLLAFGPGYRRHGRWPIVLAALFGFGLISLGVTAPEGMLNEKAEKIATLLGGLTLVAAHMRNAYFCHLCRKCRDGGRGTGEQPACVTH